MLRLAPVGRATALRAMLDELVRRRSKKAAARSAPLEIIDAADLLAKPLQPLWRSRLERAEKDGAEESLYASIREEGWRAFAAAGIPGMHALLDAACGESGRLAGIVDHRWDGIGTEAGGFWVA